MLIPVCQSGVYQTISIRLVPVKINDGDLRRGGGNSEMSTVQAKKYVGLRGVGGEREREREREKDWVDDKSRKRMREE